MTDERKTGTFKQLIVLIVLLAVVGVLVFLIARKVNDLKGGAQQIKVAEKSEYVEVAVETAKDAEADALDYYYTEQGTVFIEEEKPEETAK